MKDLVRLWKLPVEMPDLMELGRRIGADVPSFPLWKAVRYERAWGSR